MSRWVTQFRLALRSVFLRKRVDQELDEELQYHLERQIRLPYQSPAGSLILWRG
jgi:hypothetical protein